MGMPVQTSILGTGTFVFFPDWTISPFQIGVAAVATGAATTSFDVTYDRIDVSGGGGQGSVGVGLGTSAANANWFNVVALGTTTFTSNWTTPVYAMRIAVVSATSTTIVVASFIQAGLPR
jgi:hypothetical protein